MTAPNLEDRAPQVIAVLGLFLTLSTIAIMLRIYCRIFVVKTFGLDDFSSVVAWLFFVFFVAFGITSAYHGSGTHVSHLAPEDIPIGLKWWWVCEPVYVLANMALKFSIGIFLLRIAVSKTHRAIIWTVIIVTEVYCTFFFLLFVLQCTPSKYFWTRYTGGQGHCINPQITVIALYVYSVISCWADWTLGIIPVFLVWNLQMNSRTKFSVALILAVGAIGSTATVVRIPYIKNLANESDFLYAVTDVAIWSTSETGIGIAASCIATLRPLFQTFFMRSESSTGPYSSARSKGWPSKNKSSGYIRSKNKDAFDSEIALRENIGKTVCVTTVVGSDTDLEKGGNKSLSSLWNPTPTNDSRDDAEGWDSGIRKTVESTQQVERQ